MCAQVTRRARSNQEAAAADAAASAHRHHNRRLFTQTWRFFKSCEPEVVAVWLRVMRQQICMPFERVLVKGEPPRALFIIRSGHVQVVKDLAVGEQGGAGTVAGRAAGRATPPSLPPL